MEPRSRRRRLGSESGLEEDRIGRLPDELLHEILRHLRSFPAAARTSALSRRWRRLWASVPDLVLGADLPIRQGASFLDAVDGALDYYAAAADPAAQLHGLDITVPFAGFHVVVPARRVEPWLRFAARRLAVALHLRIAYSCTSPPWPREELELPLLEGATSITLSLGSRFHLRPPLSGVFAALADLEIKSSTMEARALEVLVSTQCPRLRKLSVAAVILVDTASSEISDVSLRSTTLERLKFHAPTRRLEIAAPALQVLDTYHWIDDAHIVAPNLADIAWGLCDRFVFADAGRHLRRLDITWCTCVAMALLVQRFDSVDELRLRAPPSWHRGDEFWRFLEDKKYDLPKCRTLWVSSYMTPHSSVPCMLHLLRGNGIRKLGMLAYASTGAYCSPSCSCRSPQSAMVDAIIFDSLEEIELDLLGGDENLENFMRQVLSLCSLAKLKSVEIKRSHKHAASSPSDEVYNKIRGMCPPNIRVICNLFPESPC